MARKEQGPQKGANRAGEQAKGTRREVVLSGIGVGLMLLGAWGPWVPHPIAGLSLNLWDLVEVVQYLPAVRAGTQSVTRELFFLPLWAGGLALAWLLSRSPGREGTASEAVSRAARLSSPLKRFLPLALPLFLIALTLPPYPDTLTGYGSAEFRGRFYLSWAGILLVLLSPLRGRLPHRLGEGLFILLGLGGALLPLWQYLGVRDDLARVYSLPLGWGWGLLATLAGGVVLAASGLVSLAQRRDGQGGRWPTTRRGRARR
ncbi:MAG: hypothetical protein D6759_12975 [Chloroflexi bacterium]|nr:MAG: hypothetical protein D6759_12975 [Chloroflexota bacterium]